MNTKNTEYKQQIKDMIELKFPNKMEDSDVYDMVEHIVWWLEQDGYSTTEFRTTEEEELPRRISRTKIRDELFSRIESWESYDEDTITNLFGGDDLAEGEEYEEPSEEDIRDESITEGKDWLLANPTQCMVLEDEEFVLVEDDMYDIYGEKVFDLYDFLPGDDISIITGLTADEYEEFITEDVKMKKLYKVELVRDLGFEVKTIHVWMDEDTNPDSDTFQTYINEEYEQGNITEDWEPVYIDIHEKDSIRIRDVNEVSDDERDDCIDVLGDSIPE